MDASEDRVESLITRFLDGPLDEREEQELARILKESAPARARMASYLRLEGASTQLGESACLGAEATSSRARTRPPTSRRSVRPPRARRLPWLVAAGAFIGIVSAVAVFRRGPEPERAPVSHQEADPPETAPKEADRPATAEAERARARRESEARLEKLRREEERLGEERNKAPAAREDERRKKLEEALVETERKRKEEEERLARIRAEQAAREKAPVPPAREPSRTETAVARLERTEGEVYVIVPPGKRPARAGDDLLANYGVETVGAKSRATLVYPDATRVDVGPDCEVRELKADGGKRLFLARGELRAVVTKQPKAQAMAIVTPHGQATVLGTTFRVAVDRESERGTRLDVEEGTVRMKNLAGKDVEVPGGHFAVAAPGVELVALPAAQDAKRVDEAIRRGIAYLRTAPSSGFQWAGQSVDIRHSDALLLLTFVHAGVPPSDPQYQKLLKTVLEDPLDHTYMVGIQAMCLEEIDRVKYQKRLAEGAQFLVDNQCPNGQWHYVGTPPKVTFEIKAVATPGKAPRSAVRDFDGPRVKPKPVNVIRIRKTKDGDRPAGDNSNSQVAALGLRACFDSGILIPEETIVRAQKWLVDCAIADEPAPAGGVATGGGSAEALAWCYKGYGNCALFKPHQGYGSMTAGSSTALAVYEYLLGRPWKRNRHVLGGLKWLEKNFSVSENPGRAEFSINKPEKCNLAYYLYSLERLGVIYGTETFGKHSWYPEGARFLLDAQRPDGSWSISTLQGLRPEMSDTCFAILFLRRATRPLGDVASVDRPHEKPKDEK